MSERVGGIGVVGKITTKQTTHFYKLNTMYKR